MQCKTTVKANDSDVAARESLRVCCPAVCIQFVSDLWKEFSDLRQQYFEQLETHLRVAERNVSPNAR